jgi:hypothetical protein
MSPDRQNHWLSDEFQQRVSALLAYADSINEPILELAFSWLASHAGP